MSHRQRSFDQPSRRKTSGLSTRFARLSRRYLPEPTVEEARRRIRSAPDFFASLSPEARAAIFSYDSPEVMGAPDSEFKL